MKSGEEEMNKSNVDTFGETNGMTGMNSFDYGVSGNRSHVISCANTWKYIQITHVTNRRINYDRLSCAHAILD